MNGAKGSLATTRSTLLLVGVNHRTCPVEEREALLSRVTYRRLRIAGGVAPPWDDVVLLTTCNRIEAYAIARDTTETLRVLRHAFDDGANLRGLYILEDEDAAAHLFRVASGLDSLAQGEEQIAAQVRRAPEARPTSWRKPSALPTFFSRAAHVAPRVRTLAGLLENGASASHAAVRFVTRVVPVTHPHVVLLGTGKMARIGAGQLRGRADLVVLNRDARKARRVAKALGGRGANLDRLPSELARADVVIAATSTRKPLVTRRQLRAVAGRRRGRPLWLVDLGFPRNIDARCGSLPGVTLVNIDDLAPWGAQPLPPAALARAESTIRQEANQVLAWLRPGVALDVGEFRKTAEAVRREEVERALALLPRLSVDDRAVVDKLASRLVNRFLHGPTKRLRALPDGARTRILQELMAGLQGSGGTPK